MRENRVPDGGVSTPPRPAGHDSSQGLIVGVTGQARAGKDTLAEWLEKHRGFVRIGFADIMKRFCQELFDFSDAQVWGNEKEDSDRRYQRGEKQVGMVLHSKLGDIQVGDEVVQRLYLTPRYALQTLGTEWGRHCYPNIWIEYALRVAKKLLYEADLNGRPYGYVAKHGLFTATHPDDVWPRTKGVVFSDVRFLNEFDAVREANGINIRVVRPGAEGEVGITNHASEKEQQRIPDSEFDYVILNDGSLEQYHEKLDRIFTELLGKV